MSYTPNLNLPLQNNWSTDLVSDWAKAINDEAKANNAFTILDTAVANKANKPTGQVTFNHLASFDTNKNLLDSGLSSSNLVRNDMDITFNYDVNFNGDVSISMPEVLQNTSPLNYNYAQTNLQYRAIPREFTILVNEWTPIVYESHTIYQCVKTVQSVTETNIIIVDIDESNVKCTAQDINELTFTTTSLPVADINVKVVIIP